MSSLRILIAGATGLVGRTLYTCLQERGMAFENITLCACARHLDNEDPDSLPAFEAREGSLFGAVYALEDLDFSKFDVCLMALSSDSARVWAPKISVSGCLVIDNSSYFRMNPDIPLVIPSLNAHKIERGRNAGIIASPNCSTIQLAHVLGPLHRAFSLRCVVAATYQSISGAGAQSLRSFRTSLQKDLANNKEEDTLQVTPYIDTLCVGGATKEEQKMRAETQKILEIPDLRLSVTCARVPVITGHAVAVHMSFSNTITSQQARDVLEQSQDIVLLSADSERDEYPRWNMGSGQDRIVVGRVREDDTFENGLALWIVADNVRRGAAVNVIEILETCQTYRFFGDKAIAYSSNT